MKQNEPAQIHCDCGQPLGEKQGNWWTYPNPLVCPKCKTNCQQKVMDQILAMASAPRGARKK